MSVRSRAALALAVAGMVLAAGAAEAQDQRIRVSFNAGTQAGGQTVNQEFTRTLYLEDAPVSNSFDLSGGGWFDIGGSYRITDTLWAGVAFSSISRKVDGAIEAGLPHPFYFVGQGSLGQLRDVTGTRSDLESKETGLHFSVMYLMPLMDRLDVGIFGGVSRFGVTQDLITNIEIAEAYPYDTADIADADVVSVTGSAVGFNVGADFTYRLSRMFGVGGLIRFAKGSTTLEAEPGQEVDIDAGGISAGFGIRVVF
jgi:hypothetical protein